MNDKPVFPMIRSFLFAVLVLAQQAAGQTAEELIRKGDELDRQLKTAEALKAYLEAEKKAPAQAGLLIKIAKQYGESMVDAAGREDQLAAGQNALRYAQRAVALDPNLCHSHVAVAICYGRLLDLAPARTKVEYSRLIKQHADQAVALDPQDDYAWHMLGRWHQAVSDLNGVLKGLVALIYGGLPAASLDDAAQCFEKAIQLAPDRVAHQIELGRTYALQGRKEDARNAIQRGLALPNRERDDPETKARGEAALRKL